MYVQDMLCRSLMAEEINLTLLSVLDIGPLAVSKQNTPALRVHFLSVAIGTNWNMFRKR
jgi:hypothetical protein